MKPRRIVLGEGYINQFRDEPISLQLIDHAPQVYNLACPVGRWDKVRLIAEVIPDKPIKRKQT